MEGIHDSSCIRSSVGPTGPGLTVFHLESDCAAVSDAPPSAFPSETVFGSVPQTVPSSSVTSAAVTDGGCTQPVSVSVSALWGPDGTDTGAYLGSPLQDNTPTHMPLRSVRRKTWT